MLERLLELEKRIPAWLRPTYRGALFIFGMSSGLGGKLFVAVILATLMLLAGAERGLALFLGLALVAVIAGAVAGTLRGILKPLDDWGRPGGWLRSAVTIFGFITTGVFLTPEGPFARADPTFYPVAAAFAALAAGFFVLLDDRRPGRLSPHKFASRQRLWTASRQARLRSLLRTDRGMNRPLAHTQGPS